MKRLNWPLFLALGLALACFLATRNVVQTLCQSAGCTVYHDLTIFGLSLWWYGLGFALLLAILAAKHKYKLGFACLNLALIVDGALLLLLALSSTCQNCLIIALGFGLTYLSFRQKVEQISKISQVIFLVWLMLWGSAAVNMLRPAVGSWAIQSAAEPQVLIYFSPSCPKCQEAVNFYAGSVDASFYPVSEGPEDFDKIARLEQLLAAKVSLKEALLKVQEPGSAKDLPLSSRVKLYLNLALNKSHLLAQGSQGVPYIEYRGLPKIISRELKRQEQAAKDKKREKTEAKQPNLPNSSLPSPDLEDLFGPSTAGQCQKADCH